MNFIILHGTLGSPENNWFPWLATQLEQNGHKTFRPQLPTPEGQNLSNWIETIATSVKDTYASNKEIVFIAHSMAPLAICHYLTTVHTPVHACFFVAPFADRLPDTPDPYPALNNPFIDAYIDWEEVKKKAHRFICFGSDNDPYVPFEITKNMAEKLSAHLVLVPSAGHFNLSSGYKTFPLLLETIHKN